MAGIAYSMELQSGFDSAPAKCTASLSSGTSSRQMMGVDTTHMVAVLPRYHVSLSLPPPSSTPKSRCAVGLEGFGSLISTVLDRLSAGRPTRSGLEVCRLICFFLVHYLTFSAGTTDT
jgi:hypothetical protein